MEEEGTTGRGTSELLDRRSVAIALIFFISVGVTSNFRISLQGEKAQTYVLYSILAKKIRSNAKHCVFREAVF